MEGKFENFRLKTTYKMGTFCLIYVKFLTYASQTGFPDFSSNLLFLKNKFLVKIVFNV